MSLVFSAATKQLIDQLATTLPQSLLLHGEDGLGLRTIAQHIAGKRLAEIVEPTDAKGENDQNGTIRIAQIRDLYTKTRGKSRTTRIYIIHNADRMNLPAQNAFLKLLEEPATSVHFILTSHYQHILLPTILSRVEKVRIHTISDEETTELLRSLGINDGKKIQQMKFLAAGRPAELTRLATDSVYFERHAKIMSDARTFIGASKYDRAVLAHVYAANRSDALQLLRSASVILKRTLQTKPSYELIAYAARLADAYDAISANGNVRLQLTATVV